MFQSTYTSWIKILQHLTFKINHRKWCVCVCECVCVWVWVCVCVCVRVRVRARVRAWTAHFWDNRKHPWLPCSAQKMSYLFLSLPTYLLNSMVSTTQTLPQITEMYWPQTKALYHNKSSHICHQWNLMLYQKLGAPWPSTRQDAIWWTTTFGLVLVYQIMWLPGQSSRCTIKLIRSKCNEDWWLVHICDSGDLCRYFDIYPMYSIAFVVWWIITQWHLPLDIWGGCKYCNWHFVWIRRLPL